MSCLININEYINSRDVRNYLKEIDYKFTTPEAALIIYYCDNITLEQKFELWTQIIREMPDCSLNGTMFRKSIDSFHKFLLEYIELQKKKIELFFRENDDAIYEYTTEWLYCIGMVKSKFNTYNFRHTFWECKEMFENELQKSIEDGVKIDGIHRVFFYKRWGNNANVDIEMNSNMKIMKVNSVHNTKLAGGCGQVNYLLTQEEFNVDDVFDMMYFSFPTPFKKGDILCNYIIATHTDNNVIKLDKLYRGDQIFVLDELTTNIDDIYDDGTHMDYFPYGYHFQVYEQPNFLEKDCTYINYLNLEKVQVSHDDKGILLNLLGKYFKGDVKKEKFINLYNKYLEESCNSELYSGDWIYQIKDKKEG